MSFESSQLISSFGSSQMLPLSCFLCIKTSHYSFWLVLFSWFAQMLVCRTFKDQSIQNSNCVCKLWRLQSVSFQQLYSETFFFLLIRWAFWGKETSSFRSFPFSLFIFFLLVSSEIIFFCLSSLLRHQIELSHVK